MPGNGKHLWAAIHGGRITANSSVAVARGFPVLILASHGLGFGIYV
jgi:hypothetical protein